MAEFNSIRSVNSAATWNEQSRSRSMGLGLNHFFTVIETLLDPTILVLSLFVLALYFEKSINPAYIILSIILFSLTFPGTSQFKISISRVIFNILFRWIWITSILLLTGFATEYIYSFSTSVLINWFWFAPATQIGAHLVLRVAAPTLLKLQGPLRTAVIVGFNEQGVSLAQHIIDSHYCGIKLLGFFDDRSLEHRGKNDDYLLLGKVDSLSEFVKKNRVHSIYLSLPMTARPRILNVLDGLKDTTASIYFVPDMFITDLIQGRADSACGVTVVSVCDTPFRGFNGAVKRMSDIILSLIILILISPLMILISLAVKMESPGPFIFKQRRYGLDGEQIMVYKFRSMAVIENGEIIRQAKKNDTRITRLGRFLRRTSLDELPQFINVIQGRMSIVGPRPHAVAHNELYRTLIKGYMVRHKVKPGITGWAQVNGLRGETDTLEKMQSRIDFDLDYLRNWSLKLDFLIIFKTVRLVFKDNYAY